jgi:hypothetical protein
VIYGDLIFRQHVERPGREPRQHSVAESAGDHRVNKKTGKLLWEDNSVEDRILHGQWSTPSVGTIGGVVQV